MGVNKYPAELRNKVLKFSKENPKVNNLELAKKFGPSSTAIGSWKKQEKQKQENKKPEKVTVYSNEKWKYIGFRERLKQNLGIL